MKFRHFALVALAAVTTTVAFAQARPEQQIRYRQSAMNVMGRSFAALNGMARGDVPFNKEVAVQNAQVVELMSGMAFPAFGPGTDKGAPTRANAAIWTEADKWKAHVDKLQAAAKKLVPAAGDQATLRAAVGEVAPTCKGCHDDFQLKEARS